MATPRHLLVDPVNECDYHLVSRCVRRAFLCGVDEHDNRDYSHRRAWLVERMRQLAPCFAVDIYAHTVLSNHFHLVLRHDPLAHRDWTDEEVVWRWFEAFPPSERGAVVEAKPERRELMLGDPQRLARARRTLGSMSDFMKHLRTARSSCASRIAARYCSTIILIGGRCRKRAVSTTVLTTSLQFFPCCVVTGALHGSTRNRLHFRRGPSAGDMRT